MSVKKQAAAEPVKKAPVGYTDEQLDAGRTARLEGLSWVKVAERAGVKSDGHFSRVLRARFPEMEGQRAELSAQSKAKAAEAKPAATKPEPATQGKPQAKAAKAQSKPARPRRGAKAPTGEEA